MALIKLGSLVTQISGKIGGQTFGQGPSGSFVRNTGTTGKRQTISQSKSLLSMSLVSQKWRTLSKQTRETFNGASESYPYISPIGETKYLNGYQIFAKLQNNLKTIGSSASPIPLPKVSFSPIEDFVIGSSLGTYTVTGVSPDDNAIFLLFSTAPGSIGISNPYNNHYLIAAITKEQLENGYNFSTALRVKFGAIPQGLKLFLRLDAVHSETGQSFLSIESGSFLSS